MGGVSVTWVLTPAAFPTHIRSTAHSVLYLAPRKDRETERPRDGEAEREAERGKGGGEKGGVCVTPLV